MSDEIVYGAGGVPMVKQKETIQEIAPAEKVAEPKSEKKSLQEIYPQQEEDDGFDEEHDGEEE